jgi:hypothetical protein
MTLTVTQRRVLIAAVPLLAALAAAFLPLPATSRDELFEIPPGTWDRHMAGINKDILPRVVHLTLGVKDVLVVRNQDRVPQTVGPVLIMPGQQFRMPFEVPSENQFDCTAHSDGQLTVLVDPEPTPGIARLSWRVRRALRWLNP